ncbi:MAG: hypothetical protein QXS20_02350 [Candidatus Thorarchaeota archaeon]
MQSVVAAAGAGSSGTGQSLVALLRYSGFSRDVPLPVAFGIFHTSWMLTTAGLAMREHMSRESPTSSGRLMLMGSVFANVEVANNVQRLTVDVGTVEGAGLLMPLEYPLYRLIRAVVQIIAFVAVFVKTVR